MARYARIADGLVAEIINLDGADLAEAFHPDIVAAIVAAGANVDVGWIYEDGSFSAPSASSPLTSAELLAYAADLRWRREVGGVTAAGFTIATDDRSKLMIMGSRIAAMANPAWSTMWEGTHLIDAATMIQISDAVEARVNGVWATFAAVKMAIAAGEITTAAEIEDRFAN